MAMLLPPVADLDVPSVVRSFELLDRELLQLEEGIGNSIPEHPGPIRSSEWDALIGSLFGLMPDHLYWPTAKTWEGEAGTWTDLQRATVLFRSAQIRRALQHETLRGKFACLLVPAKVLPRFQMLIGEQRLILVRYEEPEIELLEPAVGRLQIHRALAQDDPQ